MDDDIALVGSINLDIRSFTLNAEAGMLCYDPGVAGLRAIEETTWRTPRSSISPRGAAPAWRRSVEGIARLADSFL